MTKELLISSSPHETKVAMLEDDQVVEVYFQRDLDSGLAGGIYKGRVNRVLPGMQSAFVDIGLDRDAFLYVSDFFEDSEEYDRVFTEAENRVARLSNNAAEAPGASSSELSRPETNSGSVSPTVEMTPPAAPAAPTPGGLPQEETAEAGSAAQTEIPSSTAESTAVQATPVPPKDDSAEVLQREFQRRDFSSRRQRRRGRGFRENRFGFRRDSGERPRGYRSEEPSQPLEPLPGESLAKYSHAVLENPSGAPASGSKGLPEAEGPLPGAKGLDNQESHHPAFETEATDSPALDQIRPETSPASKSAVRKAEETEETSAVSEEEKGGAVESMAGESTASEEPQSGEINFESALAAQESRLAEQVEDEAGEMGEDLDEPAGPDEASDETNLSASASDVAAEASPEEFSAEPASGDFKPPVAGEEATTSQTETPVSDPPSERSYTLRDSHRPQRVTPRRGRKGGRGRFRGHHGRRPETGSAESSRGGNHQPLPINELLKEGQEILVQIAKEPLGTKGARITSHIALPGRYLVYMPTISHIGVSRKIGSDEERLRLRNIILENRGPLTGGFIVRTAGAGRSEEELKADLAFLTNLWNDIRARAERSKAPALLHRDLTLVERILRDLLSPDFKSVRVDNEIEYEHVLDFVSRFQPALIGHVKLYTRDTPLFEEYGVQTEIDKALKPKVWLKSGGYIVINQTEALVAIDVNTGKYVGKTNRLEDTIVKTNIDAVMEIVRQIRLRDLGGIIVIDFIDMDERRNRMKVVQALEDALRRDRAPTKILSFNEFGLVALTRKRVKHSLERTLCEPCPYCSGAGWVKSVATVSNEIVSEVRKMASQIDTKVMTLRVNPQVAANLKSKGGVLLSEIEAASHKDVVIKSDPSVHQERFEIF